MSDTNKETIKGSDLRGAMGFYENVLLLPSNPHRKDIYISYDELFKIIKQYDFNVEHKKTRAWGTPIINPQFDFVEFREFLLYNENCTTEEMEMILRLFAEYYERKNNGEVFIEEKI
jgi:hypothetical protein